MRRHRTVVRLVGLSLVALSGAAFVASVRPETPRADLIDPSVAHSLWVGDGNARFATHRGNAARTGRVPSLPRSAHPTLRWSRTLPSPFLFPPVVAEDGSLVFALSSGGRGGEGSLVELTRADGRTRRTTDVGRPAGSPVLNAAGLRVVVSTSGEVFGVDAKGVRRFHVSLPGIAKVDRVGLVPLSTGGVTVARNGVLFELDGAGTLLGQATVRDVVPALAARADGTILAVTANGELFTWRSGRPLRSIGAFTDRSFGGGACPHGPVLAPPLTAGRGTHGERVLCSTENSIEQIDLSTGQRSLVLARSVLPFRTAIALGEGGEIAVGGAGGPLLGRDARGQSFGPVDVSGAPPALFGDAGFVSSAVGEADPLIARDGSVLFGASEGIGIYRPRGGHVALTTRCSTSFSPVIAGFAFVSMGEVAVACGEGKIELWGDLQSSSP